MIKKRSREDLKIGGYESVVQKKGINEAFIDGVKEGQVYWRVRIDRDGQMDLKTQFEAEVISRLVRVERLLDKLKTKSIYIS